MKLTKKQLLERDERPVGNGPEQLTQTNKDIQALTQAIKNDNGSNNPNDTSNTNSTDKPMGDDKTDTSGQNDTQSKDTTEFVAENEDTIGGDTAAVINKILKYPEIDNAIRKVNTPQERADLITKFAQRIGIPDEFKNDIARWMIKHASVDANTNEPSDIDTIEESLIISKSKLLTKIKSYNHG